MVAITSTIPAPQRNAHRARVLHAVPANSTDDALRRLLGLVAAAVAVLAVVVALGYLTSSAPTTPGAAGTTATLADHVVAEGETMWSIAQAVAPAGEAATYVERLVDANGGAMLSAGQVLTVPVP